MSTKKVNPDENPEVVAETVEGAEAVTDKVYKFNSANKWLTCTALGVQFVDGKAQTTNLEVAKALVKIEGVTHIEE